MTVERKEVLFSSLNILFTCPLFVEQLFHHLFAPFSLPYFVHKYGFIFLVAHGYLPFSLGGFLFNWVLPFAFYLTLISSYIEHREIKQLYIVPVFFYLTHRCMIALKYATLSQSEYRTYLLNKRAINQIYPSKEDIELSANFIKQLQLIPGWLAPSRALNLFELESAARRLGINVFSTHFYAPFDIPQGVLQAQPQELELQRRIWTEFVSRGPAEHAPVDNVQCHVRMLAGGGSQEGTFTAARFSLHDVSLAILESVDEGMPLKRMAFVVLLALVVAAIPLITWQLGDGSKSSTWVVVFYECSTLVNVLMCFPCFMFVLVGLVDMHRRYRMFLLLGNMIQPTMLDTGVAVELSNQVRHLHNSTKSSSSVSASSVAPVPLLSRAGKLRRQSVALAPMTSPHSLILRRVSPLIDSQDRAGTDATRLPEECDLEMAVSPFDDDDEMRAGGGSRDVDAESGKGSQGRGRGGEGIHRFSSYIDTTVPRIHTNMSSNVEAWSACRLIMGNFGARFKYRVDLYLMLAGVLLMFSLFTSVYIMSTAKSVEAAFSNGTVCQLTLISVILFMAFTVLVTLTYLTNKQLLKHIGALAIIALNKKRELDSLLRSESICTDDALALETTYRRSIESIHDTITSLEQVDYVRPAKLFGFIVMREHAVWLVTTYGLYLYMLVGFLMNGKLTLAVW